MNKITIYNHLPISLQNLACSVEGYRIEKTRYPQDFDRILEKFKSHDNLSLEQIKVGQLKMLRRLLIHCNENVPYYGELFRKLHFNPYVFDKVEQIRELPVLTKATVNKYHDCFIANGVDQSRALIIYTGGTTGASLKEVKSYHEEANKWAVWWRYRERLGITRGTKEARFASNQVVPMNQHKPPYWRVNKPGNVVYFSQYHLNKSSVGSYVKELEKQSIEWIHGYSSVIAHLANLMLEKGLYYPVKYITVGAENLYESQVKVINQAFGIEPYQHYGNTEGAANFSQYPDGKICVDEDFSYVEFEELDGKRLVIGTNFYNYTMPLIRYSTGDCAELSDTQDDGFRIISKIIGREGEFVVLPDGSRISAEALDTRVFANIPCLGECQINQVDTKKIVLSIVPLAGFTVSDENLLKAKLKEMIGLSMSIEINRVNEVKKSKNGKHRLIISTLHNRLGGVFQRCKKIQKSFSLRYFCKSSIRRVA